MKDKRDAEAAARQLVRDGKFKEAKARLEAIKSAKDKDAKVNHNLAVLNFLISGKQKHGQLEAELSQIITKCAEQSESMPKDLLDLILFHYNRAVALYQMADFWRCCESAKEVFKICKNKEVVKRRPDIAVMGCFLLIEVLLLLNRVDDCDAVMQFLQDFPTQCFEEPAEQGSPSPAVTHTFRIRQFAARIALARRNFRTTKTELKAALNLKKTDIVSMFLKSSQEYLRGYYSRSTKLLTSCEKPEPTDGGQHLGVIFFNNMGVIHLRLERPSLAIAYLRQAVDLNTKHCGRAKGTPAGTPHSVYDRNEELLYNVALAHMQIADYQLAFSLLDQLAPSFGHSPTYWLRMAECCVGHYATQQAESFGAPPHVYGLHNTGIHRRAVLKRAFRCARWLACNVVRPS
ncbi:hypothetical protein PTSG_07048 [Salpingoeca rosetta]|uniref:CCR4-NOT transcription complex subunit 10 n=1 Tax=Salpingoeca rosetta (strain ATCC 50818 / BSB-021) TaxID=946362 RepID=F2UDW4_SALR5|nr:uncharacterized protein PTSG_07048 [Salpingoeca rosetta]EGD74814.1 hypothetical protein PTSG_07048 [Salpingoeca rosetta]|eukprot:XP_004992459.1 hypothetical protein PTSG_07048 [Salpingoeca rosetta]